MIHDAGTLANHCKYLALGKQFTDPKWRRNFTLCFGFPHVTSGTDVDTAASIEESYDAIFSADAPNAHREHYRAAQPSAHTDGCGTDDDARH